MMKSVKSWLILLVIYVAYLVIGGFLFNYTECPSEIQEKNDTLQIDSEVETDVQNLKSHLTENDRETLERILDRVRVRRQINNTDLDRYGHQSTTTPEGRMACLAYAIIGIPLNAILIGALGSVFSNKFKQYKKKLWDAEGRGETAESRPKVVVVLVESIVFIFFFTSLLMLVPAAIFSTLEEDGSGSWNYLNSVYYTFITLSTVGFGDMVPDRQENLKIHSEVARVTYLIVIILWIIIGMGYIFAVVDVMADTLRSTSKPVKKALRGIRNQMFVTDYWKKIINEIIEIKQSDINIDDSAVLVTGGGSEPCFSIPDTHWIDVEAENPNAARKAVSTGDINQLDQLDASFEEELNVKSKSGKKTSEIKISENFLTVPGGHRRTRASSPDTDGSFEEINDDTITSLRQFMSVAKIEQPLDVWMQNNLPDGYKKEEPADAPTRQVSRAGSLTGTRLGGPSGLSGVMRRNSMKSNLSRQSSRTAMSGPVGDLLEQTTLGEFLAAVENVRRKSQLELTEPIEDPSDKRDGRKESFFRSIVSSRKNSVETRNNEDINNANTEGNSSSKEI